MILHGPIHKIAQRHNVPRRYRHAANNSIRGKWGSIVIDDDGHILVRYEDSSPKTRYSTSVKRDFALKLLRENGLVAHEMQGEYGFVACIQEAAIPIAISEVIGAARAHKQKPLTATTIDALAA